MNRLQLALQQED